MAHEAFSRTGDWGVLVKKMRRGEWEAFVRMLPVPGLRGEYVAEGELVPGGPYQDRDAARTAGENFVAMKNRHQVKTPPR